MTDNGVKENDEKPQDQHHERGIPDTGLMYLAGQCAG